jgi:hypothetical protein
MIMLACAIVASRPVCRPNRMRQPAGFTVAEDQPAVLMFQDSCAMRALYPLMSTQEILAQELLLDHEQQQHLQQALQQPGGGGGSGMKQGGGPRGRKGHEVTATAAVSHPGRRSPAGVEGDSVDPILPLFSPAAGEHSECCSTFISNFH